MIFQSCWRVPWPLPCLNSTWFMKSCSLLTCVSTSSDSVSWHAQLHTTHLSPKVLEDFFFFSFVRNPFDRIVSSYFEATVPLFKKEKGQQQQSHRQLSRNKIGSPLSAAQESAKENFKPDDKFSKGEREKNAKLRRKASQQPGLDVLLLGGGPKWSSNVHFRSQVHQLAAATMHGKFERTGNNWIMKN